MWRITSLALALAALALPASASAAPALVPVGSFDTPMYVTAPRTDTQRLFVVERAGRIRVVRDGATLATPFLDIASEVATDGERGMLSMAFAGDYEQSGLFYVYMVARDPVGELQVREYRRSDASPDVAAPTGRIVWRATHNEASNHNGGQIAWGPDGLLWFATGDGGGANDQFGHARDVFSQLGKVLRIDPRPGNAGSYSVPDVSPPNPLGTAVFAYGLRNPFRFSFDRATGDLLIGDVGQGQREEISWARTADGRGLGADYGWACREGTVPGPGDCDPERRLPPARVGLQPGLPARGGRRLCRARHRPADARGPLRLRGHLRRRRALAAAGAAARCRRPARGAAGARADRLLRRGRLRLPLRRLARGQRRARPGRGARPVPDPAARAAAALADPGAPARGAPAAGSQRRRGSASGSRARAAWAAARSRGSSSWSPRTAA